MNRTLRAILAVILIGIITAGAVSICQNLGRTWRADITESNLYTLEAGTQAILARVQQPLTLRFYYARTAAMKAPDQIKFFNDYANFVQDILEEYRRQSDGMIKLEVIDPRPFSEAEEEALRYNLRRIPLNESEGFFFGLVLETPFGVIRTIPFFSPDRQNFVEYDISALIDRAITREKKRLGVLSSLPVMGDDVSGYMAQMMRMQGRQPRPAWTIIQQLQNQYDVQKVETEVDEISTDNFDLLLIVHPKDLPEKTLFAIDQFILQGGRTVICLDPHCWSDQPDPQQQMMGQAPPSSGSSLEPLLRTWGLTMPPQTFAGDRTLAVEAPIRPNARPETVIGLLDLGHDQMNTASVITGSLNQVTVFFAGALEEFAQPEVAPDADTATDVAAESIELTPLITTTARGNTFAATSPYELQMPDRLLRNFVDGTEPVVLAYRVSGRLPSSFPEGIDVTIEADNDEDTPPGEDDQPPAAPEIEHRDGLTVAENDCAVVVVADVDFMTDMLAFRDSFLGKMVVGDNMALLLNSLEVLTGSTDLISIRSRGSFERPFTVVDEIEARAQRETAEEVAALEAEIAAVEQELQDVVAKSGSTEEALLASGEVLQRRELELKRIEAQRRLRQVQQRQREDKEALGRRLEYLNTATAPAIILVIAILLAVYRGARRRRSISHASDA